jgi:phosphocarrier protein FPr
MVSLVIVSHSAQLAAGVRELAQQMVQGQVAIAAAGGIDDPENPFGTDPMQVLEAINAVYDPDGVVVLMDLGSALLSAEMAVEVLEPEQQQHIYLCPAPLVEGTVSAAVQASVGADVQQVMAEAQGALATKREQLGLAATDEPEPEPTPSPSSTPATQAIILTIHNRQGLHARPAARFVSTANQFAADIRVYKADKSANAKSINAVATLGARRGDTIRIEAAGEDAEAALAALQALADEGFGEDTEPVKAESPPPDSGPKIPDQSAPDDTAEIPPHTLRGVAASPGVAFGPVALYRPVLPEVNQWVVDDPQAEWARLQATITTAGQEIQDLQSAAVTQIGASEAEILAAHRLILQDPELLTTLEQRLQQEKINAEAAWQQEMEKLASRYAALDDAYMQARAADIQDVAQRVLTHLLDLELPNLDFDRPVILVAGELTPSDTVRLDTDKILGLCTERGGATAHSAILARALGIPAVVGAGPGVWELTTGLEIGLDGTQGLVWTQPDANKRADLQARQSAWRQSQQDLRAAGQQPAVTQDGRRIEVAANIGRPEDAAQAIEYGAEGVGLFRTEFLFLDRDTAPDEAEQLAAYRQVAERFGDRPVIIRTLDVGGDKPLPYLDLPVEDNPFLGVRGIRFCLARPELFKTQLRAILRAGVGYNIKLMLPMISTVAEVRESKALVETVKAELAAAGEPFVADMDLGIMIEVPAAVVIADQLAPEVAFFSIGTNDLTQYVMAADRGNAGVANLIDALQPAVLRMVKQTVEAGHAAGIWVGMCGELAGNPEATAILVGLGLDELSMSAPAIPAVKATIRNLTLPTSQTEANRSLQQN